MAPEEGTLLGKLNIERDLEDIFLNPYLIGRAQYAYFNGIESDKEYLSTGVPQGSVLGPLLFLVYIITI